MIKTASPRQGWRSPEDRAKKGVPKEPVFGGFWPSGPKCGSRLPSVVERRDLTRETTVCPRSEYCGKSQIIGGKQKARTTSPWVKEAWGLNAIWHRGCPSDPPPPATSAPRPPLSMGRPWRRRKPEGTDGQTGGQTAGGPRETGAGGLTEDRPKASFCPTRARQKSILRFTLG
jgi:hypothetical protein